MKSICIGIAGGTGSGKSTVAIALAQKYPDRITLLHLDDYFQKEEHTPVVDGMLNRECPEALRLDDFLRDLSDLKSGKSVSVRTRSPFYNPTYETTGQKLTVTIPSRPIILAEGYLILCDERIRALLDYSIFLDIPLEVSVLRRKSLWTPEYYEKILVPEHRRYVEASKRYATHVIDVSHSEVEEVVQQVESMVGDSASRSGQSLLTNATS